MTGSDLAVDLRVIPWCYEQASRTCVFCQQHLPSCVVKTSMRCTFLLVINLSRVFPGAIFKPCDA